MTVQELGEGRLLIDLDFNSSPGIIGSYLIPEEEGWAVVETGPTSCKAAFLRGLAEAGIAPVEIKDVFVTHIHLDHAGGAGALVDSLPKATFHMHELGVPHLVDPSKLIASAQRAWGDAGMALWGPIVPIPADRVHALKGGERFPLERGGHLSVLATPGHANHHLSFYDSGLAGVLTGDGAGVLLPGSSHIRPAMPPPELDVEKLIGSLERMRAWAPQKILFSHFGPADGGMERLLEAEENVQWWVGVAREAMRREPTVESLTKALEAADEERSRRDGEQALIARRSGMISGYQMAAMGLHRYFTRKPPPSPGEAHSGPRHPGAEHGASHPR